MNLTQIRNSHSGGNDPEREEQGGVLIKERQKVAPPKKFQVIMHNDDYTTMEFVILVLKKFFKKDQQEAEQIMWKIHHDGFGVCGVYIFEIAESKAHQVIRYARDNGHPLKCTVEPED